MVGFNEKQGLKMTTGVGSLVPTPAGPLGGGVCYPLHVGEHVTKSDKPIYRDHGTYR